MWKDPAELETLVDGYFAECTNEERPPTICGLALHLGCDRKTLTNYAHKDEFFPTIKKARQRVEAYLEASLYSGSVAGVIFNLKNNFDWKDKTEVESHVYNHEQALSELE